MYLKRKIEEEVLLLKIRHGDQEAFAQVYDSYVDQLYRYVSFRVRTQELAQDLTSDLFLRVWQHLTKPEGKGISNLRAYLYQVARNLIADHYRTEQKTLPLDEALQVTDLSQPRTLSPDHRVSLREIEQALTKLKPEWQEVVVLAYVEGLKPQEIAIIIGKTSAATRVILHRALQELKSALNTIE
jgi:RNA polymerase sigma-70 factor (ECF subfamily)